MVRHSPLLVLFLVFLLPRKLPVGVEGSPESEPEPANESISRQHGGGPKCPSHEPSPFNSDVHIAKFEFERVQTIFIILIFITVVVLAKMGEFPLAGFTVQVLTKNISPQHYIKW